MVYTDKEEELKDVQNMNPRGLGRMSKVSLAFQFSAWLTMDGGSMCVVDSEGDKDSCMGHIKRGNVAHTEKVS